MAKLLEFLYARGGFIVALDAAEYGSVSAVGFDAQLRRMDDMLKPYESLWDKCKETYGIVQ